MKFEKLVMSCVIGSALILSLTTTDLMAEKGKEVKRMADTLSIEKIFENSSYAPKIPKGLSNRLSGDSYEIIENNNIIRVRQTLNKEIGRDTLLNWELECKKWNLPQETKAFSFFWNSKKDKVVVLSDKESIYRWSYTSNAYLFSLSKPLSEKEIPETSSIYVLSEPGKIQLPSFSPNGDKLVFLRNNNMYRIDFNADPSADVDGTNATTSARAERASTSSATTANPAATQAIVEIAITTDGQNNSVRNGHSDWVYEEEFGFAKAYEWSPNGEYIAYLRFDESDLKQFCMTTWGDLYPQEYIYKYPKAGELNSVVSLHLYNVKTGQNQELCHTSRDTAKNRDTEAIEYIPRIRFSPKTSTLLYYTLNRRQNNLQIWKFGTENLSDTEARPQAKCLYAEADSCYVEIDDDFYFAPDESFWIAASGKNGYRHLYMYDFNGKQIRALTSGKYDVATLYGVDQERKVVYFQANYSAPYNKELMCVGLNGKGLRRMAYDIQVKGGVCSAIFSSDYKTAILTYSNANIPPMYCLYALNGKSEQLLSVIEGNDSLRVKMQAENIVAKGFGAMKVSKYRSVAADSSSSLAGNEQTKELLHKLQKQAAAYDSIYYWVMKPEKMEEGKKYPVLMFLYGGPGSQQVLNQYGGTDYWWYSYLVQQGNIVVCVDNRGTGGRGESFKKCTYLQLGRYETEDQIAAAKYISKEWNFVDSSRIGIWGWSYGGFMSSSCLFKGDGLFKMAMAVAPVTNWRFYDNVYTERFMRTPLENPQGYDLNSPINMAADMKGALLLVHGSSDDNVHLQNSMELVTALQKNMKQFDFQIYPNKNHSIYGGKTRQQLYSLFTRFIKTNL